MLVKTWPNFSVERMAAGGTRLQIRERGARRHRSPRRSAQRHMLMRLIVPVLAVGLLLAACTTTSSDAHIARKIEGTWTHNIPWIDGQERTLTLKASRDAHGKLSFD